MFKTYKLNQINKNIHYAQFVKFVKTICFTIYVIADYNCAKLSMGVYCEYTLYIYCT